MSIRIISSGSTEADQCWSNAAQARRAPTRDRERPQFAEPDGRPVLRPRGRTHRTVDPAHPCTAPSSKLSVDGRFTSTESRFTRLLKRVLQQNRPQPDLFLQPVEIIPVQAMATMASKADRMREQPLDPSPDLPHPIRCTSPA